MSQAKHIRQSWTSMSSHLSPCSTVDLLTFFSLLFLLWFCRFGLSARSVGCILVGVGGNRHRLTYHSSQGVKVKAVERFSQFLIILGHTATRPVATVKSVFTTVRPSAHVMLRSHQPSPPGCSRLLSSPCSPRPTTGASRPYSCCSPQRPTHPRGSASGCSGCS